MPKSSHILVLIVPVVKYTAGQQIPGLSIKTEDLLFANQVEIILEKAVNRCRCIETKSPRVKTSGGKSLICAKTFLRGKESQHDLEMNKICYF